MEIKAYISSFNNISFYAQKETKDEEYIFSLAKRILKRDINIDFNNTNYKFHSTSIFQDFFIKPLIDILNANLIDFSFKKRENYTDEIEIIPKTEEKKLKEADILFSIQQATINFNIALEAAIHDRLPIVSSTFYINNELIMERKIFNKIGYTETENAIYARSFKNSFSKKRDIKENIRYMYSTLQNVIIKGIKDEEILNEENPVAYIDSSIIKGYISRERFVEILKLSKYDISYISLEKYTLNRIYKLYQGSDVFKYIKMIKEQK